MCTIILFALKFYIMDQFFVKFFMLLKVLCVCVFVRLLIHRQAYGNVIY